MLASSSEYIKALREGKYLLFLEWIDFVTQKYALVGAEDTINFLIFEWLNNDYSDEDAKKIAILQAVSEGESRPLQVNLDYALKAITHALFICMVFHASGLDMKMPPQEKIKQATVEKLMQERLAKLNLFTYKERLDEMQAKFYKSVDRTDKKEVLEVLNKINVVTGPRYLLDDYILHLERIKIKDDELYATRLSMAKRFLSYLYEQTEMTPKVAETMATYVNSLRELHPSQEEIERLDNISPPSNLETTWRWVAGVGVGFFNIVFNEKSIGEVIAGTEDKPNP
ncbi:helical bundle domain-containing protein [Legionella steelei]|uniref:helical bundle domain-containing protein n=1 Tax=Legionella steelei TaxID=947033 RepID=UPI001ACB096A|nr:helical bundle domain-containing protein [Legionella steelei]MBN9228860.1 helical bundle domain-containing protein [Legionella steelei]